MADEKPILREYEPLAAKDKNEAENVEKLLTAVIKGRTTVPDKCFILHKRNIILNSERWESSRVKLRECKEKENFKRTVQEIRRLKNPYFSVQDLLEAQGKFDKCLHKTNKVNDYLKKQKNLNVEYEKERGG